MRNKAKANTSKNDSFTASFVNHSTNSEAYKTMAGKLLNEQSSCENFKTIEASTWDLFNLLLNPEQAYKLLKNKLNFNKHNKNYIDTNNKKLTPEWVKYFNQILNESIDFYERVFYEKLYISHTKSRNKDKKWKIKLKNHEEVVSFLMYNTNTKHSAINRSNQCFLLKIMRALNDFNIHQKNFNFAEENFDKIQREYMLKKFKTQKDKYPENKKNIKHLSLRTQSSRYNTTPIYFTLDSRTKSKDRIIIKNLCNSKYNSSSVINDIYGFRCQVKDEIDALRLLEYYWITFGGKIYHKNIFWTNPTEIDKLIFESEKTQTLNPKFKKFLLENIKTDSSNKKKNSKNYKDVKIVSEIEDQTWEKQKVEIQITLEWNNNDSWTAHHWVYEIKALIEAEVRWRWFINMEKIKLYIKDVVEKNISECVKNGDNPNILYLWWFSREQDFSKLSKKDQEYFINRTEDYIRKYIENDFLDWYELKYPEKWKNLYTTETQRNKFHNTKNKDLYPAGIELR